MQKIKKLMSATLIGVMALSITSCSSIMEKIPFNTNFSLTLNVENGDGIKVEMDTTDKYSMKFDAKKSIFDIKNPEDESIMQGIFMTEDTYSTYYETAYTSEDCKIINANTDKGIDYTFYQYDDGEHKNQEFLGWIVGSNTGVIFESTTLTEEESKQVFEYLTFSVDKTSQEDKEYILKPEIKEQEVLPINEKTNEEIKEEEETEEEETVDEETVDENTEEVQDEESKTEGTEENTNETIDLSNIVIKIDGKDYKFPYSYDELKSEGWTFDKEEYGYKDGFTLKANEHTYNTITLTNEKYGTEYNSAAVEIGFKNFTKDDKDIMECPVWALEVYAIYGSTPIENHPEIELPGGIIFGSTEEEIIAAYGDAESTYKAKIYKTLDYQIDSQYITFYIYNDYGLMDVDIRNYTDTLE